MTEEGSERERFSCARASLARDEPLLGTASTVRRWLLLEQPGAWGADALLESDLPTDVARPLHDRTQAAGIRLVLIRRTGGGQVSRGRRVYAAWSAPSGSWLEQLTVREPADLLGVDLDPLREGRSIGGRHLDHPLYLVCTNGAHDPCCAEFGLPVAKVLSPLLDERVWECSHIGGDRFAGNLVALPTGVYHGRVTPETAATVVAAHDAGAIHLATYRGRSTQAFAVQAADDLVRRELGLTGLDDLVAIGRGSAADGALTVRFRTATGETVTARLVVERTEPCPLTCHAPQPRSVAAYRLDDLEVFTPA